MAKRPRTRELPTWLRMTRETPAKRAERLVMFTAYRAVNAEPWRCFMDQCNARKAQPIDRLWIMANYNFADRADIAIDRVKARRAGLRIAIGAPCPACGIDYRRVGSGACVRCSTEKMIARRIKAGLREDAEDRAKAKARKP